MQTDPIIILGRHAKNKLRRYRDRLVEAEITAAIEHPDEVTPSEKGRSNAWKQRETDWIRVTYRTHGNRIDVVTITLKDRGPRDEERTP